MKPHTSNILLSANDNSGESAQSPRRENGDTAPHSAANKKRILVVDDDPRVTRSLRANLEDIAGYQVRTENDSALAVEAAREFQPHVILLEVLMPGMDGFEVLARIHDDPQLKNTPILFLTDMAIEDDEFDKIEVAGSTVYLVNPLDAKGVIRRIEKIAAPVEQLQNVLSFAQ